MKPFHSVAVPHKDILEGNLTMDVFAADLWKTFTSNASDDYKDPETFFEKTYVTEGLKNILDVVEKRLKGIGGDPVIQIQTPFGGGKTHTLIAMYHKAKIWNAKTVVIVGTTLNPNSNTIWGEMAKQLGGNASIENSKVSPGRKDIHEMLLKNSPVLILMDEVMEFMAKAAGVNVGDSNLALQTLAFMQEISEEVAISDKVCLVVTLPSSTDPNALGYERYYLQLQKILGRIEKIYTPVQDNEIAKVIRKRLFSSIDEDSAKEIISKFIKYAQKEDVLPTGVDASVYRNEFLESYPFTPEVIDVLYKRWGTFPNFQRTRGVLRLLALVIKDLKESYNSFISLADFNLANEEIKRELIKNIGPEFSSVIASDITSQDSGAKKVDNMLGSSNVGLKLGTRTAITIFMYSFSGGHEKGAYVNELKRSATILNNPTSTIAEAVDKLKGKLFYLQVSQDKYFFSNEPNINRILLTKMENVTMDDVYGKEQQLLKKNISNSKMKVFIWPNQPSDVPDNTYIKLIILKNENLETIKNFINLKGESPRVYRNTLLFLCPLESEKIEFIEKMKEAIAYEQIKSDKTLNLNIDQREEISKKVRGGDEDLHLLKYYRKIIVPSKDSPRDIKLDVPTYAVDEKIDDRVYSSLRQEEVIQEKIFSKRIKEKFIKNSGFTKIGQIYDSVLKTPGEIIISSFDALKSGIIEGIKKGDFGIGILNDRGEPVCKEYYDGMEIDLGDVLINDKICTEQTKNKGSNIPTTNTTEGLIKPNPQDIEEDHQKDNQINETLTIKLELPHGKVSYLLGVMNFLQSKFGIMEIEIKVRNGKITKAEYDEKIKEAFAQIGIDFKSDFKE
ncbi:MAG: ATP-binding protein [Thermoplasmata archaeon]